MQVQFMQLNALKTETLTSKTLHNPDTFYGLGKCFSEDLAKMYYENGLESVCLRIASCAPVTTFKKFINLAFV